MTSAQQIAGRERFRQKSPFRHPSSTFVLKILRLPRCAFAKSRGRAKRFGCAKQGKDRQKRPCKQVREIAETADEGFERVANIESAMLVVENSACSMGNLRLQI